MKKLVAVVMSVAVLLLTVPVSVGATSSNTKIINKHGSKTYMGTYSDWNKSWDSDNFTDVTDDDIDCSDTLIIKGGTVGDVTVSDNSSLTISGGTVSDVVSDGSIRMTDGTVNSLKSDDDISISGGTVKNDVEADDTVTLSGELKVGGSVTAQNVEVVASSSSGYTTVSDDISFEEDMTLQGTRYKIGGIDGQSVGTLVLKNFTGTLPAVSEVEDISVESYSTVTAGGNLDIDTLTIDSGSVFSTKSSLTVNTIKGPGTLKFTAGNLKIKSNVSGHPVFAFNSAVSDGTAVFKAKSGTVSVGDVTLYGCSLTRDSDRESDYDTFVLHGSSGSGISLDTAFVNLPMGCTYYVLAVTDASIPPMQMSYNSSVAVVGKAAAYYKNGRFGWLYPVTAVARGAVTINIGGQKMIVAVTSGSMIVDTSSYTLSPGKTYCIGVKLNGTDRSNISVYSENSCVSVQYKGRAANGVELYLVKANSDGTGYAVFSTAAGGYVRTQINVVKGAVSHGTGGRLIAKA